MIPTGTKPPQSSGMLLSGMAHQDKSEQTRRAADATESAKDTELENADPRAQQAAHLRASRGAKGRASAAKRAAASNKGRDARTTREAQGANAERGNQDLAEGKNENEDVEEEEEEEEAEKTEANDLFWKNLVWGAYRSRKRRGEE